MSRTALMLREAVAGNGTTTIPIPPHLTTTAVLSGRVICRTASTAASKTILVKYGSTTLMTFTTPASAAASTLIEGVRATSASVTTIPSTGVISLVAHASLASKTFDVYLDLDEHAILKK